MLLRYINKNKLYKIINNEVGVGRTSTSEAWVEATGLDVRVFAGRVKRQKGVRVHFT